MVVVVRGSDRLLEDCRGGDGGFLSKRSLDAWRIYGRFDCGRTGVENDNVDRLTGGEL